MWFARGPAGVRYFDRKSVLALQRVLRITPDRFAEFVDSEIRARVDSLAIVEIVMELEEEFNINIPDEVAERIRTVSEALAYLAKRIREG